jgi:hypothetical protein
MPTTCVAAKQLVASLGDAILISIKQFEGNAAYREVVPQGALEAAKFRASVQNHLSKARGRLQLTIADTTLRG